VPTLDDHEARITALEASQADYRAVLAAVNALGANQREHSLRLANVESDMADVKRDLSDLRLETRTRFRSVDEQLAEIKDLIVGFRNG
jgi:septation ring formation regulator EzrA